jgi:hypothetical protein
VLSDLNRFFTTRSVQGSSILVRMASIVDQMYQTHLIQAPISGASAPRSTSSKAQDNDATEHRATLCFTGDSAIEALAILERVMDEITAEITVDPNQPLLPCQLFHVIAGPFGMCRFVQ